MSAGVWPARVLAFMCCMAMFALNEVARELEVPFHVAHNDINIEELQKTMNARLLLLIHPAAQHLPRIQEKYSSSHEALCRKLSARAGTFSLCQSPGWPKAPIGRGPRMQNPPMASSLLLNHRTLHERVRAHLSGGN